MRLQQPSPSNDTDKIEDLPPIDVIEQEPGADPSNDDDAEQIRPWPDDDIVEP
jgi:hypothetical protein